MFRSHSLIALPVLLLPLYGAATALPQAPQTAQPEIAENLCVADTEQTAVNPIDATPAQSRAKRERPSGH